MRLFILAFLFAPYPINSQNNDEKNLIGKYHYLVDVEFVERYESTIWIKKQNRFKREIHFRGISINEGNWQIKDSLLYLIPDDINNKPDTFLFGKDFILEGKVGKHMKLK